MEIVNMANDDTKEEEEEEKTEISDKGDERDRGAAEETTTAASSSVPSLPEDNIDGYFADVGFLFEDQGPTKVENFEWTLPGRVINVQLRVALLEGPDTEKQHQPTASVQSGHVLWPAAKLLADYLVQQQQPQPHTESHHSHYSEKALTSPTSVVELGAGCALLSCMALHLWQATLECIVVTDHDAATLERARDNYECTLQTLLDRSVSEEDLNAAINDTASIHFGVQPLTWGSEADVRRARNVLGEHQATRSRRASIIVGSELLYQATIVRPLLQTAKDLLAADGVLLLATSFRYVNEIEDALVQACTELGLERQILVDQEDDGSRIQQFRLREQQVEYSANSFDEDSGASD